MEKSLSLEVGDSQSHVVPRCVLREHSAHDDLEGGVPWPPVLRSDRRAKEIEDLDHGQPGLGVSHYAIAG